MAYIVITLIFLADECFAQENPRLVLRRRTKGFLKYLLSQRLEFYKRYHSVAKATARVGQELV
jgi:hypothetical protein